MSAQGSSLNPFLRQVTVERGTRMALSLKVVTTDRARVYTLCLETFLSWKKRCELDIAAKTSCDISSGDASSANGIHVRFFCSICQNGLVIVSAGLWDQQRFCCLHEFQVEHSNQPTILPSRVIREINQDEFRQLTGKTIQLSS